MIVEQDGKVMINNRIGISGNADQEVRKMAKLRECPFCGYEFESNAQNMFVRYGEKFLAVVCPDCDARGPKRSYGNTTINAWNRRAGGAKDGRLS